MIFAEIDRWVGTKLFIPPIIKFCRVTRQSQYAVSRLFWFLAALDGFYRAQSLVMSFVWGGLSVYMLITANRRVDQPTSSFMFLRMLALFLLVLGIVAGFATGAWSGVEFWLLVLIAEYAASIRTLPPEERSKRAGKAAISS